MADHAIAVVIAD